MELINKELLDQTKNFFNNITKEDKVAVIHHTDPDGVCSGVIVAKTIQKIRDKPIDLRLNQNSSELFISKDTLEKLKEKRINKVIITDMSVDQDVSENKIETIPDFAKLLIIDHHKLYRNLNSNKIVLIKPHMIYKDVNSAQYCAAKFCFDICSKLADIKELDWIASIGIIGDCGYETWKFFVDNILAKYEIEKKTDIFYTELGRIADIVSCTEAFDIDKIEKAFDIIYNAKNHKEVLNSELRKYKEDVKKEIDFWRTNLKEKAEIKEDLIYYEINPKYPVKSNLCTLLSFDFPDKTIVLVQEMEGENLIAVSARRRDNKVAMNDMLEYAAKGLEKAGGGGHIPAAGGRFLKKDKQRFKKRLFEWLKI